MPALAPCVSRTSADMVHQSTMEDKRDLVFHEEIFQLPASIVSNDKNAYEYFFLLKFIQHDKNIIHNACRIMVFLMVWMWNYSNVNL